MDPKYNTTILCIDDEKGILDAYKNTLANNIYFNEIEELLESHKERTKNTLPYPDTETNKRKINFRLLLAHSGEEAVEIVRHEIKQGRKIAAGFFDMSLPGIDGIETLQKIRELDPDILCAIVTAYADYSVEQISKFFQNQDEWIYFNKPFSGGELKQCAYNLIDSWNRRRREEKYITTLEINRQALLTMLKAISQINKIPPLPVNQLLQAVLDQFNQLLKIENGFFAVVGKKNKIQIEAAAGKHNCHLNLYQPRNKKYLKIINSAVKTRTVVIKGPFTAIPLTIDKAVYGIIVIEDAASASEFIELLNLFGIQIANLIENSRLYSTLEKVNLQLNLRNAELTRLITKIVEKEKKKIKLESVSLTDTLTKVANRQLLDKRLAYELDSAKKYRYPLTCILMDIDHFKKINNTYGHIAGYSILIGLAEELIKKKRVEDIIIRYAGDRFFLIFPKVSKKNALLIAERIRKKIEEKKFRFNNKEMKITISMGMCTFDNNNSPNQQKMILKINSLLEKAKKAGRNKICA